MCYADPCAKPPRLPGTRMALRQSRVPHAAPVRSVAAHPLAPHHLARLEHLLDQMEFAPDKKNVMHLELLRLGASGLHVQVAGAEAEHPVAEQVAAPLRDDHTLGVVGHLAAADILADPHLTGGENHGHLTVEEQ